MMHGHTGFYIYTHLNVHIHTHRPSQVPLWITHIYVCPTVYAYSQRYLQMFVHICTCARQMASPLSKVQRLHVAVCMCVFWMAPWPLCRVRLVSVCLKCAGSPWLSTFLLQFLYCFLQGLDLSSQTLSHATGPSAGLTMAESRLPYPSACLTTWPILAHAHPPSTLHG